MNRPGSQHLLTAEAWMEKFAAGVACEADRAPVQRGKKASSGKACQLRKTLTAEPGTAWRPQRRAGARLSRAQDVFDCVAIPRHSRSADGQRNCIPIYRRLGRELTVLPLRERILRCTD